MKSFVFIFMIGCIFSSCTSTSATSTSEATPGSLTGNYVMAFHACDTAVDTCSQPVNHDTYVAQSDDGISWTLLSGYTAFDGSVPDLIRRDDVLYVYAVDSMLNQLVLRRYHITAGTWDETVSVTVLDENGEAELLVDPSLIIDEDGKLVLFYLNPASMGGDPAMCESGETSCTKTFRSATEQDTDGAEFVADSGNRLELTISSSSSASDPDIFEGPEGFVLYISRGSSVQVFTATSLRDTYEVMDDGLSDGYLVTNLGGIPSGYYSESDATFSTYVHSNDGDLQIIRRATHTSLATALDETDFTTVITGDSFSELGSTFTVASPGFAPNVP